MKVSTPGRICLFGEHQDYLGLPVVAAAISRRVWIEGDFNHSSLINIALPDIASNIQIDLEQPIVYQHNRDYFRSALKLLMSIGYQFSKGFDCRVTGNIPINSGTSSSSALLCAWVHFLMYMSDEKLIKSTKEIGELSYKAEVEEFNEAGGMMDQYATAMGHVIYLESVPKIEVAFINPAFGTFVLGDSLQPKDTQKILSWVKFGMLDILKKIKESDSSFDLFRTPIEAIERYKPLLSADEFKLLKGNIDDRDILRQGLSILKNAQLDHQAFGDLLNRHQTNLRDAKKISTTKIDNMIDSALQAGALGAKINGSGGGGCMFAYAPTHPEKVAEAIEQAGGKAYILSIDDGTRLEPLP